MFWQRYLDLCNKVDKSPNAVAAACGVKSSGTVTGWSTGSKPRAAVLKRISEYFGVSVAYLLGKEEKSPPPVGNELTLDISDLNEENREILRTMAAKLLASQPRPE